MHAGLVFLYFIIITIIFFIFLFTRTDFKEKLSELIINKIDSLQGQIDDLDKKIKNIDEETQFKEYNKLKLKMRNIVKKGRIAEVRIAFSDKNIAYKIYGFAHYVIFAREGEDFIFDNSQYLYKSLDELYKAVNMDSVCLEKDWSKITDCRIRAMKIIKVDA